MITSSNLFVNMDLSFRRNILPMIDSQANIQNKTRADIIREILYAKFNYTPKKRDTQRLTHDYGVEHIHNHKKDTPTLLVCVDADFADIFAKAIGWCRWIATRDIIAAYYVPVQVQCQHHKAQAEKEILDIIQSYSILSTKDIVDLTGISKAHVYRVCERLADEGMIQRVYTSEKRNSWKICDQTQRVLTEIGDKPITKSMIYVISDKLGISAKTVRDCLKQQETPTY